MLNVQVFIYVCMQASARASSMALRSSSRRDMYTLVHSYHTLVLFLSSLAVFFLLAAFPLLDVQFVDR